MYQGKIFLDMDGVLVDFWTRAKAVCGIADPDSDTMWAALNKIPHYFNTLDIMDGAKALFDRLYEKYGDR